MNLTGCTLAQASMSDTRKSVVVNIRTEQAPFSVTNDAIIAKLMQEEAEHQSDIMDKHEPKKRRVDLEYQPAHADDRKTGTESRSKEQKHPKAKPTPNSLSSGSNESVNDRISSKSKDSLILQQLIEAGLLESGPDVLEMTYKGSVYKADLSYQGMVSAEGEVFDSPNAFSLAVKRRTNPSFKTVDGWKAIKYKGRMLYELKGILKTGDAARASHPARSPPANSNCPVNSSAAPSSAAPTPYKPSPKKPKSTRALLEPDADAGPPKRTEYARSRPQRERRTVQRLPPQLQTALPSLEPTDEELEDAGRTLKMVPCQEYALASTAEREGGASASTTEAAAKGLQPFEVEVERASCLVMDLHAHLCHHEIIGFLGGAWDPHTRKLTVQRAFPVRQLDCTDNNVQAEMDPADQFTVVEAIHALNLQVVGWYHSHPVFVTQPSITDIRNQFNHQSMWEEGGLVESRGPFIGAIIGPYADDLPEDNTSDFRWFYVHREGDSRRGGARLKPMQLTVQLRTGLDMACFVPEALNEVVGQFSCHMARVDLHMPWRDNLTHVDKLRSSLAVHLPQGWSKVQRSAFLKSFLRKLLIAWYPEGEHSSECKENGPTSKPAMFNNLASCC